MKHKIEHLNPKDLPNHSFWPMHIKVDMGIETKTKILGRTCGRDGIEVIAIDENGNTINRLSYDYKLDGQGYENKILSDLFKSLDVLIVEQMLIHRDEFIPIMKRFRDKCESRYGNKIPDSDFEVMITFEKILD